MVRLLIFCCLCSLFGCNYQRVKGDFDTTSKNFDVRTIDIIHNGEYSDEISSDESADICREFILSEDQVVLFFSTAYSVNLSNYEHELIASNCYADGNISIENRVVGSWRIDRARRGLIKFNGREPVYYFCADCNDELYYEPCDLNCVHSD